MGWAVFGWLVASSTGRAVKRAVTPRPRVRTRSTFQGGGVIGAELHYWMLKRRAKQAKKKREEERAFLKSIGVL